MLGNLLLGISMMLFCLMLQIILLIQSIRYYNKHRVVVHQKYLIHHIAVISGVMILILLGNVAQISSWALLFMFLDEFDVFKNAFYHSAVNFGSLGYGDIVMSEEHRLLGALEAINGVLMIGVSTAALMPPFKDAVKIEIRY